MTTAPLSWYRGVSGMVLCRYRRRLSAPRQSVIDQCRAAGEPVYFRWERDGGYAFFMPEDDIPQGWRRSNPHDIKRLQA